MSTDRDDLVAQILAGLPALERPTVAARFVDWSEFWERDRTEADWLFEDVLARGRGHAFYAKHKTGKSLFLLWLAAKLATGPEPVVSIYCDFEMTEDDLYERLGDMGYGPDTDLSRLRYWLLPELAALDTPQGGAELESVVAEVQEQYPDHHVFLVIDTTGRAVEGPEDKADTFQAFYSFSGIRLKRMGVTYARADHAGKDVAKGQRGSSAKADDVDLVWRVVATDEGIELSHGGVSRIRWAPDRVAFRLGLDPLEYRKVPQGYPPGTKETVALLDELGVPVDASGDAATKALRSAGKGRTKGLVLAAQRARRNGDTTPTKAREPEVLAALETFPGAEEVDR